MKMKRKKYTHKNRNVKAPNFQVSDTVLVKQPKINKLTPPFNTDCHSIIAIKGSMITAKSYNTGRDITRNSSFFKKIPDNREQSEYENYIEASDTEDIVNSDEVNGVDINEGGNVSLEEILPRRNPIREHNRPQYLRGYIQNLLEMANG